MIRAPQKTGKIKLAIIIAAVLLVATFTAGLSGYYVAHSTNNNPAQSTQPNTSSTAVSQADDSTVSGGNLTLPQIYQDVAPSVVVIEDFQPETGVFGQVGYEQVQGSGFVYDLNGQDVIVTNNHVVDDGVNVTVTFQDGTTYSAKVLGTDVYSDLAVLSTTAPQNELVPLTVVSSSTLQVGDTVIAIGAPYGLEGSMTTGIISALNRTITEDTSGNYEIADVIQTSAAINPGNSGGPLLNADGQVIGITTATLAGSDGSNTEGLGFAIPSDTILREVQSLATTGTYSQYSYMGIGEVDMTYDIAQAMNSNVNYGVLVESVASGSPAAQAGLKAGTTQSYIDGSQVILGGDIIIAINGSRIRNSDDLSTYLQESTTPGQTINLTVIRNNQSITISLTLGTRPAPSSTASSS